MWIRESVTYQMFLTCGNNKFAFKSWLSDCHGELFELSLTQGQIEGHFLSAIMTTSGREKNTLQSKMLIQFCFCIWVCGSLLPCCDS